MSVDTIGVVNQPPPRARPVVRTAYLLLACVLASVGIAWLFNTHVMTRDVYQNLLGGQLDADRIDHYFDLLQRRSTWSLAAVVVIVLLRVGLVSLVAQLVLLLGNVEVQLATLFRASLWAFGAPLTDSALRTWALMRQDPRQLTQAALSANPASLAQWLLPAGDQGALRILLGPLSLVELAWVFIMSVRRYTAGPTTYAPPENWSVWSMRWPSNGA
jgi:hypothetical protein